MLRRFYKNAKRLIANKMMGIPSKSNYKFIIRDWTSLGDLRACSEVLETKRFYQNVRPIEMDCPGSKRILVIAPHPDDDLLGAGGTLIKAVEKGSEIHVSYITNGDEDPEKSAIIREEMLRVCSKIGTKPHFLGCCEGNIPLNNNSINNNILSLVDRLKPSIIFIPFLLDDHDDHRRVNHLLLNIMATKTSRSIEIWSYQIYSTVIPNVVVNITTQMNKKSELIRIYKNVKGNRDWAHYMSGINAANCRYIPSKKQIYVEAFFVLPIKEYLSLCTLYFNRPANEIYYKESYCT